MGGGDAESSRGMGEAFLEGGGEGPRMRWVDLSCLKLDSSGCRRLEGGRWRWEIDSISLSRV